MKTPSYLSLLAASVLLIPVHSSQADVVARYEFNSNLSSTDSEMTSVASDITAFGFTPTFNLTAGNPQPSIEERFSEIVGSGNPLGDSPTPATTDYYEFTISGTAPLDYTTLTLDAASLTSAVSNNTFSISLQTSLDGFATNVGVAVVSGNTTFTNFQFDLSSFNPTASPVTFRLALRDNGTSTTNGILIDNIVLNATVIPEPSTYAMMVVGVALLVGGQRLRKRR